MMWFLYLLVILIGCYFVIPFLLTKLRIRKFQCVGSYIISGPPRTGKSALATCLAQYHKGRVVSPFPIQVKKGFAFKCSYDHIFSFNVQNSDYAFQEHDLIILDELSLKLNSNDLDKAYKNQQESLGQFAKLIGHLINGTFYVIEQHPDRIPKQLREKVDSIVQIKKLNKLGFWIRFEVNVYSNLDDYNKKVLSNYQAKKLMKKGIYPPSYSGEVENVKLWFPKKFLKRYDSRVLKFIHDLKVATSTEKKLKKFKKLEFGYEDFKNSGLEKLESFIKKEISEHKKTPK